MKIPDGIKNLDYKIFYPLALLPLPNNNNNNTQGFQIALIYSMHSVDSIQYLGLTLVYLRIILRHNSL
ncbi:hypothetical protein GFK82_00198 [Candidatus Steffania adelgidicola]|nr:hypothetical protein GFK82_00198 [Candidatus Steffania adelgidicola]